MRIIKMINRKGQVIILVTFAVILLLLLVGLALDSGIGYAVKAKLNSAVDAAAIAAGRAGSGGDTAAAVAAATTFFHANFPVGYLRAEVSEPTVDVSVNPTNGQWTITVSATAVVPTYFLRIRGNNAFTAKASAVAVKRDLDMAFVIDTTSSITNNPADPGKLKSSAVSFIDYFSESSDRVALMHFALGTVVDDQIPPNTTIRGFNKTSVKDNINSFSFGGRTNFSEALWQARVQLNNVLPESRSSLRVIVFFTDGDPNSFSSTFTDNSGGAHPGVISTDSTGPSSTYLPSGQRESGGPYGLNEIGRITSSVTYGVSGIPSLPPYFNVGGSTVTNTEFGVTVNTLGSTWRPVGTTTNYTNVNFASRNLAEDMAKRARTEGIFVFTLGLGMNLTLPKGPAPGERGDHLLVRMANDPQTLPDGWTNDTYDPTKPVGMYCHAVDADHLKECFDRIANMIFRLTQ